MTPDYLQRFVTTPEIQFRMHVQQRAELETRVLETRSMLSDRDGFWLRWWNKLMEGEYEGVIELKRQRRK